MFIPDCTIPKQFSIPSASRAIFKNKSEVQPSNTLPDFTYISTIAEGKKCKVFIVSKLFFEKPVVLKVFPHTKQGTTSKCFTNEIRFKFLDHPNIIKLLDSKDDYVIDKQGEKCLSSYILMEYAPNGNFSDFIKFHSNIINDTVIRTYFHQLIDALSYMHSQGAYHLDLKPENLLMGENYQLKLADFDGSYLKSEGGGLICLGTMFYRAPELIAKKVWNLAALDIYSAGIILFVLKTGRYPFREEAEPGHFSDLEAFHDSPNDFWKTQCKLLKKPADFFDEDFKDLFQAMTTIDPLYRVGIEGIRRFNWFKKEILTQDQLAALIKGGSSLKNLKAYSV